MRKSFKPFLSELFDTALMDILVPGGLLAAGVIKITVSDRGGVLGSLLVAAAAACLICYLAGRFITGLSALLDLTAHSFQTENMTFVRSYSAYWRYTRKPRHPREPSAHDPSGCPSLNRDLYLVVVLANERGRASYLTADFHSMKEDETYTVTYGKHSRILISARSVQGEEMLYCAG